MKNNLNTERCEVFNVVRFSEYWA